MNKTHLLVGCTPEEMADGWAYDERYKNNEYPGGREQFLAWCADRDARMWAAGAASALRNVAGRGAA